MGDFYFGNLGDEKELKLLKTFLLSYPMNYPGYKDWVEKICIPEIEDNWKKAILAFYRQHNKDSWELVGNAIYQATKESQLPNTLHFKNMRVKEGFRREGVASFLIKQVEKATKAKGLNLIILDFRKERKDLAKFLLWHGYKPLFEECLYDDNNLDVVMVKTV
ncbi:MAG: GNAT family N-acetyltransferase [Candidatus Pacearchaeota archaeon]|nr:MAG: GNAT family N-acetyltransferase [Candidatus Pacearchaeota archaeon]